MAAAEFGLRAIVLEKHQKLGGGTAASHGGFWVAGNHLARAEGVTDSRENALAYMRFIPQGRGDCIRRLRVEP